MPCVNVSALRMEQRQSSKSSKTPRRRLLQQISARAEQASASPVAPGTPGQQSPSTSFLFFSSSLVFAREPWPTAVKARWVSFAVL